MTNLEELITEVLPALSNCPSSTLYVRFLLGCLDECNENTQRLVLRFFDRIIGFAATSFGGSKTLCKILISSQETRIIANILNRRSSVRLEEENSFIFAAIWAYTNGRLDELQSERFDHDVCSEDFKIVEHIIVDKSEGIYILVFH